MRKLFLILALVLGATAAANAQKIEGTWRALSLDGKSTPEGYWIRKIYTKDQFVLVLAEGDSVVECVSGTYTFDGKKLTEKWERVTPGTRRMVGQTMVGEVVFEGQKMNLDGVLKGLEEQQVWERVE